VLLVVTGVSLIVAGIFPHVESREVGAGITLAGIHSAAARGAAAGIIVSMACEIYAMRNWPGWRRLYRWSFVALALVVLGGLGFVFDAWPAYVGLFETVMIGAGASWFVAFAAQLHRVPILVVAGRR